MKLRLLPAYLALPLGWSLLLHAALALVVASAVQPTTVSLPALARPHIVELDALAAPAARGDAAQAQPSGSHAAPPTRPEPVRPVVARRAPASAAPASAALLASEEHPADPTAVATLALAAPAPRFVLTAQQTGPALTGGSSGLGDVVARSTEPLQTEETWPASRVSVPARLLSSPALRYPAAARTAELEADVPLELVVDRGGHVVSARALRVVGYGLEQAALSSAERFVFSPALVDGRPVRVRMRWTVQFRLR